MVGWYTMLAHQKTETKSRFSMRLPRSETSSPARWQRYLLAVGLPVIAFVVSALLEPVAANTPYLLFMLAVTVSAWLYGTKTGLVSTVVSLLLANYFFIEPRYSLHVHTSDAMEFTVFVITAFVIGGLESSRRSTQRTLSETRREMQNALHNVGAAIKAQQHEEHEQRIRSLLDNLPALVGLLTPDGVLIEANRTALDAANLTLDDVLKRPFQETYWWSYSPAVQRQLANAIERARTGETVRYDVVVRTGPDHFMTIDFMLAPLYDAAGNLQYLLPSAVDITERKRGEVERERLVAQVEAERQRLQTIIANVPGIVWEGEGAPGDGSQRVVFVSDYAEKLLGYPAAEWLGNTGFWGKIVHPDDLETARTEAMRIFENGSSGKMRFRGVSRTGEIIPLEAHTSILRDANGDPVGACGVVMDVRERKYFEDRLAAQAEDLRRSNEELEQFAYVASHDLQEPLRMVTSYLELIEQRYQDRLDDDASEFIAYAVDGAERMKALINDLLAYSRVQRVKRAEFKPVDLHDILQRTRSNLQLTIEDTGAEITHDPLPTIIGNAGQMSQLLQNLLSNAIKFRGDTPPHIHIGAQRVGDCWQFSVADNGIGIEPQYLDRIFVIFQRLHSRQAYAGTGIGLAICKRIVENHGGRIWVESEPGAGTTFYFTIHTHKD